MRGDPVKQPRRIGQHVSRAIDFLAENGATDIRVWKTKHVIVSFMVGQHRCEVRMAGTPMDAGDAYNHFRAHLRHELERAATGVSRWRAV